MKILVNRIKCNNCGDIIESTYDNDFKWCSCHSVAVGGGLSSLKRTVKNSIKDYKELGEVEY